MTAAPRSLTRKLLSLHVIMCLIFWSVMPLIMHVPSFAASIQGVETTADTHDHHHEPEEDIYWSWHGHGHDAVDHDHNPALTIHAIGLIKNLEPADLWPIAVIQSWRRPIFLMERPPKR